MAKTKVVKATTEKPYGWCFDKHGNAVNVSAPMTESEIKKLKVK
jgi:hypothetical protein